MKPKRTTTVMPSLRGMERILPNSMDAEMAVLGSCLLRTEECLPLARDILPPDAFYYAAHQVLYRAMCEMQDRLLTVDMVTLTNRLEQRGMLDEIGGASYLADLVAHVPTTANLEHYCKLVSRQWQLRQIVDLTFTYMSEAYNNEMEPDQICANIMQRIGQVSELRSTASRIDEVMARAMEEIDFQRNSTRDLIGLDTGYGSLNRLLLGLQAPNMYILAARPSVGKTSLAMNIATNVARIENTAVAVFSLEQGQTQIAKRMLSVDTGLSVRNVRYLVEHQIQELRTSAGRLGRLPIFLDDTSSLRASQVAARCRALKARHDIRLAVVDYLQLMAFEGREMSRNDGVTASSGILKGVCKSLGIPMLILSQLNRGPANEGGKPRLNHLRDSGSIEQDADAVAIMSRCTDANDIPDEYHVGETEVQDITCVDVAKHRDGPIGETFLRFNNRLTRFEELTTTRQPENIRE